MNAPTSEHRRIAGNAIAMLQRSQIAGHEAMLYIEVLRWIEHAIELMEKNDDGRGAGARLRAEASDDTGARSPA